MPDDDKQFAVALAIRDWINIKCLLMDHMTDTCRHMYEPILDELNRQIPIAIAREGEERRRQSKGAP